MASHMLCSKPLVTRLNIGVLTIHRRFTAVARIARGWVGEYGIFLPREKKENYRRTNY